MIRRHLPPDHCKERGVALVIVLSLVVLLTIIVTAFFSRSILNRQIAGSSAAQMKADNVAQAAVNIITSDLRQEINAGSKADGDPAGATYTVNGIRIFVPKTNKSVIPARIGTDDTLPNLVRRSVRSDSAATPDKFPSQTTTFPTADYDSAVLPKNRASFVSSIDSSQNQRFISLDRWNKPLLLSGGAVPARFTAPDWVILTRKGPQAYSAWDPSLKDATPSNQNYAIGRYACTVYDEGGLLDINIAGYPVALAADDDFKANKGRAGQINLNDIPGIAKGTDLVTWRNAQTGGSAATYRSYLFENTPSNGGFLKVTPGDQTFLGRQDLISYQKANPGILSADALQYLGTFSREKNAPTFTPDPARSKVKPGNSHAPAPGYDAPDRVVSDDPGNANTFGQDDVFNPSLLLTKDSGGQNKLPFSRRFALSRLALLTASGPAAGASDSDIKKYFGLVWNAVGGTWSYTSPDGAAVTNQIKFLKNITNREPDFFETLQAAIHIGSLGRDSDGKQYYLPSYEPGTSSTGRIEAQNTYYQVMQIGANIIDQADTDNFPTGIEFGGDTFAGIENLPYLTRIFDHIYPVGSEIRAEYTFEVWNPHQDTPYPGGGPTDLRIIGLSGGAQLEINGDLAPPVAVGGATAPFSLNSNSDYRSPTRLGSGILVGIYTGAQQGPGFIRGNPNSTFALEYQSANGQWHTYQKFRRLEWQIKPSIRGSDGFPEWFHMRVDPRTDRFGTCMNYLPGDPPNGSFRSTTPAGSTLRPDTTNGYYLSENTFFAAGIFSFAGGQNSTSAAQNSTLGVFSDNSPSSPAYYADPDGTIRPGDGAYRSGNDGQPLAVNNAASRPLVMNRPLRSVGELGYVFRDLPWKSLDFFSPTSGDLALLDAFCVDDSEMVAGRVNINTRQTAVLTALLNGGAKREASPTASAGLITLAEATSMAQALVARTTDPAKGPLTNRIELLTKFGPGINYSSAGTMNIKAEREAALRSLAEISDTRTWNLLVDIVAQSGRFNSAANTLALFNVEGERRYWLHLAIDRYTGAVIDQKLEVVNE